MPFILFSLPPILLLSLPTRSLLSLHFSSFFKKKIPFSLSFSQVYDITKRKTFETLQQWISELRAQGPENIVLAIAGNKSDLEDERQVCACG